MIESFDAALAHGIRLTCRAVGAGDAPRVMLLHGFPEGAFIWDDVMQRLPAGLRCIAPDLRGYGTSSAPREISAYRVKALVEDLVALIELQGGPLELLVAHDWGGALAWSLAASAPHCLRRLLIINSPHPAIFLRELLGNPAQRAASAYMNFLCRPDAALRLTENDFERLWPFFTNMGGAAWLDDALRERYRAHWRHGIDGALNYYRASPLRPPLRAQDPIHALVLPPDMSMVRVPTTVLWGEADIALPPTLLDGLEAFVPTLDVRRCANATHWLIHEQPALVVQTIAELLEA